MIFSVSRFEPWVSMFLTGAGPLNLFISTGLLISLLAQPVFTRVRAVWDISMANFDWNLVWFGGTNRHRKLTSQFKLHRPVGILEFSI